MRDKAFAIKEYITDIRRRIHQHPELGYQEFETQKLIKSELEAMGFTQIEEKAKTGIVASLKNGNGPCIALRADIDALPIEEETGLEYSSKREGVMHACGHDSHTAMLLGAAKILKEEAFQGEVRFLFQPSEEHNYDDPDGWSGGKRMVMENVLEGVDAAMAIHQIPQMPLGAVSIKEGPVLAAADFFEIRVKGKSAHAGASPELGIDAIVVASQIVNNLQTVVSRNINPAESGVVSVTTFHGGSAPNIIADEVVMTGTIRALDDEIHQKIVTRVKAIIQQTAAMHDTEAIFTIKHGVPVTFNHVEMTAKTRQSAQKVFGEQGVIAIPPVFAGEDFAYMARQVPSCFALLGTKIEREGEIYSLHHPKMILNEDAMPLGTALFVQTALDFLNKN
ncbi:M20 family metallopeptidase [Limibacter armeniacum]|uniref:M20 metallopeptidase family protein n=1 Tax=Limibacter armeniacum TaxID=466084 RepID=UPI002FE53149